MKFRYSAPALLIGTSLVVVLALTVIANFLTAQNLQSAETSSFRLMRDVLASILKTTEDRALNRAELVTSMPAVRKAFAARDREKLLAECSDMYKEQAEKYGVDQAQFHLPPGVSFLRLHKPEKFGDDQTSYRPMLADVHQSKALRKGVAITKAGPAIFGIVPIQDDTGAHIGSFEMGLEFSALLDKIKASYRLEAAAFIDEKMLRDISTDLTGDVMSPQNRVGKYMRIYATHPELSRALVLDRDVNVTEPSSYQRSVKGTPWGVQLVPMYNYANKQIGVFALSMDFSETRAAQARTRIWQALSGLVAILILTGMILVVIRGVLIAPLAALNERMTALAQGDATKPADPLQSYCEELRTLAQNYEQLRSQRTE